MSLIEKLYQKTKSYFKADDNKAANTSVEENKIEQPISIHDTTSNSALTSNTNEISTALSGVGNEGYNADNFISKKSNDNKYANDVDHKSLRTKFKETLGTEDINEETAEKYFHKLFDSTINNVLRFINRERTKIVKSIRNGSLSKDYQEVKNKIIEAEVQKLINESSEEEIFVLIESLKHVDETEDNNGSGIKISLLKAIFAGLSDENKSKLADKYADDDKFWEMLGITPNDITVQEAAKEITKNQSEEGAVNSANNTLQKVQSLEAEMQALLDKQNQGIVLTPEEQARLNDLNNQINRRYASKQAGMNIGAEQNINICDDALKYIYECNNNNSNAEIVLEKTISYMNEHPNETRRDETAVAALMDEATNGNYTIVKNNIENGTHTELNPPKAITSSTAVDYSSAYSVSDKETTAKYNPADSDRSSLTHAPEGSSNIIQYEESKAIVKPMNEDKTAINQNGEDLKTNENIESNKNRPNYHPSAKNTRANSSDTSANVRVTNPVKKTLTQADVATAEAFKAASRDVGQVVAILAAYKSSNNASDVVKNMADDMYKNLNSAIKKIVLRNMRNPEGFSRLLALTPDEIKVTLNDDIMSNFALTQQLKKETNEIKERNMA